MRSVPKLNPGDTSLLHIKMVSRVTPANTTCPAAPAPPTPDSGVNTGLTTQNKLLAEQNNLLGQMTTLLTQLVQNTAASATPGAAAPATPATPAASATPATPVATPVNFYGQETLTHVTREHILAILAKSAHTATAVAAVWGTMDDDSTADRMLLEGAARMVLREMAELIYSIPENRNWITRREHPTVVIVHSKGCCDSKDCCGRAALGLEELVDYILKTIVHLLETNLTSEDKGGQYEDIIMSIEDPSEEVRSAVSWVVEHLPRAATGNALQPVATPGTS